MSYRGRLTKAAIVWLVLIGAVGIVLAAGPFEVAVNDGARFNASATGPTIWFGSDVEIESGNPFPDANTVRVSSDIGWANATSTGATEAQFDVPNGTWTNVSALSVSGANLTIEPEDKQNFTVGGQATALQFRSVTVDDDSTDFIYTGGSGETIVGIEGLSANTQYGAIEDQQAIDAAVSDGSGTVTFTELPSGTHTVEVETFGNLEVRNETNASQLVTKQLDYTILSTDGSPITEGSTSNGLVDLTDIPVDDEYVFVINDTTENYFQRTIFISDLSEQSDIFLLNKSEPSRETAITITDQTGDFPPGDTRIKVQKPLNQSKFTTSATGFAWTTISGDTLSADQAHITFLRFNDRYRFIVSNSDGDTRVLGEYTAINAKTVPLEIESVDVTLRNGTADFQWGANKTTDPDRLIFTYNDSQDQTGALRVVMFEWGNESNELHNQTYSGPHGTLTVTETLTADQLNVTWAVKFSGSRNAEEVSGLQIVGSQNSLALPITDLWVQTAAVGITLIIPALLRGRPEVGAVLLTLAGGVFWWLTWYPPEIGPGVIGFAMLISIFFYIRERRSGESVV